MNPIHASRAADSVFLAYLTATLRNAVRHAHNEILDELEHDRRAEAHANEGAAYGQLQVQKLQSIEVCRRAGNRLAELYPNQQDRVRSYFRRVVRRPRATAPTEGETAPATGAAATATAAEATPGGPTLVVTPAATPLASGTPA